MSKPIHFIGLGAVKSGSSWMASLLRQHPEVCMSSRKEIAYFNTCNFNGSKNESSGYTKEYYLKFWPVTTLVKGEVSPQYLYDKDCALKIKATFPQVQLLIMLRNPKQVVFSHFIYEQSFNKSIPASISFLEAVKQYPYLLKSACFSEQLARYFEVFNSNKLHVYFLDESLSNTELFSKALYSAIGLKQVDFVPNYASVNESKQVGSNFMNRIIRFPSILKAKIESSFFNVLFKKCKQTSFYINLVKWRNNCLDLNVKSLQKPVMSPEELAFLDAYFESEIEALETLLAKDLSRWKAVD